MKRLLSLASLIMLSAVLMLPAPSHAEPGADFVVVIDQSNSMSGAFPRALPPNDKYGARIALAQGVAGELAARVGGNTDVYRMSVVEFGSRADVTLSGLEIRYDPDKAVDMQAAVMAAVVAGVKPRNMEYTDTPAAMDLAMAEMQRLKARDPDAARVRAILLITDGRPYKEVAKNVAVPREELFSQIRVVSDAIRRDGIALRVVGINDYDDYWNRGDGTRWAGFTGQPDGRWATNAEGLIPHAVEHLQRHIRDLLGASGRRIVGNKFQVPAYTSLLTVQVYYDRPAKAAEAFSPSGARFAPLGGAAGTHTLYTLLSRENPEPGEYSLNFATASASAILVNIVGPQFDVVGSGTAAVAGQPFSMVMQVKGADPKKPVQLDGATVRATLTAPSGTDMVVDLTTADHRQFGATVTLPEPGEYKVRAAVTLGTENLPLARNGDAGTIKVGTRPLPSLVLEEPDLAGTLAVNPFAPSVTLRLRLVDGLGAALIGDEAAKLITDPDAWLSVRRLDVSGVAVSDAIPLVWTGEHFAARVPVDLDWKTGNGVVRPAQLHLRIDRSGATASPGDAVSDGVVLPPGMTGRRIAGNPATIAAIEVQVGWLWPLIVALILLLPLGAGLIYLLRQLSIARKVRQEDAHYGGIELLIYDRDVGPMGGRTTRVDLQGKTKVRLDGKI